MRQLLLDIQTILSAIPELQYAGEACGQLDPERIAADAAELRFPCALIALESSAFRPGSGSARSAETTVSVTVADRPVTTVVNSAPQAENASAPADDAFLILTLAGQVRDRLHGHGGSGYTRLECTAFDRVARKDTVRELRLTFRTAVTMVPAAPATTPHPTPPGITFLSGTPAANG